MNANDPYIEWDAAYVLGSLSSTERHEFERHLATCARCSEAVADLAGLPGMLSTVSTEEATALLSELADPPLPDTLLPRLVRSAERRRRRSRGLVAGIALAAAAAAAAIVLTVPLVIGALGSGNSASGTPARTVSLSQVVPSPLSATIKLVSEGWGTSVKMDCRYGTPTAPPAGYSPKARSYAMFVTDTAGNSSQIATWTAGPGSTVEPWGTTSLSLKDISTVDIRSVDDGTVLLSGTP